MYKEYLSVEEKDTIQNDPLKQGMGDFALLLFARSLGCAHFVVWTCSCFWYKSLLSVFLLVLFIMSQT